MDLKKWKQPHRHIHTHICTHTHTHPHTRAHTHSHTQNTSASWTRPGKVVDIFWFSEKKRGKKKKVWIKFPSPNLKKKKEIK